MSEEWKKHLTEFDRKSGKKLHVCLDFFFLQKQESRSVECGFHWSLKFRRRLDSNVTLESFSFLNNHLTSTTFYGQVFAMLILWVTLVQRKLLLNNNALVTECKATILSKAWNEATVFFFIFLLFPQKLRFFDTLHEKY